MALRCGIVGLPNVGKSTLFNALTANEVAAENYPFCTIDPNVGLVELRDPRLDRLAEISGSARTVPAAVEFTDIAGLVKGAASGEGLGNQFLGHIRETDAIVHVVRCFEDAEVTRVTGAADPVGEADLIGVELALADLAAVERAASKVAARGRIGDADARFASGVLGKAKEELKAGRPVRRMELAEREREVLEPLFLLTMKPVLYVANVGEESTGGETLRSLEAYALEDGCGILPLDVKIESEIATLDAESRAEFMAEYGMEESGLDRLARAAFDLLGLQVFFTSGPQESRAWVIRKGIPVEAAAGVIHTDMEKGFIKAEVIGYEEFLACGGAKGAREAGKARQEGKGYPVREGDVIHVRFSV